MFKGDRLKKLREQKKLTQEQLGRVFNISHATINRYEKEQRQPDTEILNKLADFFDVSTDYLFGRINETRTESIKLKEEDKKYKVIIDHAREAEISPEDMKEVIELIKKMKN